MPASYKDAKRIALGLTEDLSAGDFGADIWSVSPGMGMQASMPYQYFEKGFEAPPKVIAQKVALSLFDEYESDRKHALTNLSKLSKFLEARKCAEIAKLLSKEPPAEWLNHVFLEQDELQGLLISKLEQAGMECKTIIRKALVLELEKLVDFKDLFEALVDRGCAE